jgi:hypothetical protein
MHVNRHISVRHYPSIAGFLQILLSVICMYISVSGLVQVATKELMFSQASGPVFWLAPAVAVLGVLASVYGLVGGFSSLSRHSFRLSVIGSYLTLIWYVAWLVLPVIASTLLFGVPIASVGSPSNLAELLVLMAIFAVLLVLPASLNLVLIKKSQAEFTQKHS